MLDEVYGSGEAYVANEMRIVMQLSPDEPPAVRYVDVIYQPIRDASNAVCGIFVQGNDVTDAYLERRELLQASLDFRDRQYVSETEEEQ